MAKPDEGHRLTDEALSNLEKRITSVYRQARDELQNTVDAYFASFADRDEAQRALLEAGEITEEYYRQWRLAQIGRGQRFEALRDQIAERMTRANETAVAYVNDATPGIYALNRNYAAYTIEQAAGNVSFTLWDEQTVRRLIVEQPDLMPYYPPEMAVKRGIDLAWGKKQITAQVTSGILQGTSVKGLADDLQVRIPTMNRDSAVRTARTAVTGAQNAGRMDGYAAAQKMGIRLQKEWLATLDSRTRHSHAMLDGERVENDAVFSNGCRFPGDPHGPPAEVYNCRCTLIAYLPDAGANDAQRRGKGPKMGSAAVEDMSYADWEKWVQRRQYSDIIGAETATGIKISAVSAHLLERAGERIVSHIDVLDAISNPLHIGEIITDHLGRKSQRFIGGRATVNINPDTGNIVTVWKTGKKERRKYGGEK